MCKWLITSSCSSSVRLSSWVQRSLMEGIAVSMILGFGLFICILSIALGWVGETEDILGFPVNRCVSVPSSLSSAFWCACCAFFSLFCSLQGVCSLQLPWGLWVRVFSVVALVHLSMCYSFSCRLSGGVSVSLQSGWLVSWLSHRSEICLSLLFSLSLQVFWWIIVPSWFLSAVVCYEHVLFWSWQCTHQCIAISSLSWQCSAISLLAHIAQRRPLQRHFLLSGLADLATQAIAIGDQPIGQLLFPWCGKG